MKKLLSILGTIGLTTTSTTSLISCEKPNNNENGGNKPEPNKPQQPPENSKWKLIDKKDYSNEIKNINNKWYIAIVKNKPNGDFSIIKFNFSDKSVWNVGPRFHMINGIWYIVSSFYQWQGDNNPANIPEIDINTGKITDWKE